MPSSTSTTRPGPADDVLRQRQRAEHQRPQQGEHAEAQGQPGHHQVGPLPVAARGRGCGGGSGRPGSLRPVPGGLRPVPGDRRRRGSGEGGPGRCGRRHRLAAHHVAGGRALVLVRARDVPGSLGATGQEHHRQDRQDAGRNPRDEAADQPDQDQRKQRNLHGRSDPRPPSGFGSSAPLRAGGPEVPSRCDLGPYCSRRPRPGIGSAGWLSCAATPGAGGCGCAARSPVRREVSPAASRRAGSALQPGQQVGVDGVGFGGGHAVGEARVGLQRPVLDQLGRLSGPASA